MHCFSFVHLMIPDRDPSLKGFAVIFKKLENAICNESIDKKAENPLFHVEAFYANDAKTCKVSLLYADPNPGLDDLKREFSKRFEIPATEQKVKYIGVYEKGTEPDVDKAIKLMEPLDLDLDTRQIHSVHVTQWLGRPIEVHVTSFLKKKEEKIILPTFSKKTTF